MSEDNSTAIYHVIQATEGFSESAHILLTLVHTAQKNQPGKKRVLYLDIEGHRNEAGGFDADTFKLLKEFLIGYLAEYLSEINTPLYKVANPNPQNDNIPAKLPATYRGNLPKVH